MPEQLPENWQIRENTDGSCTVKVQGALDVMLPDRSASKVSAAGQLPTGFEPEKLYQSRNHPRGLQMAVYGASDAVRSVGIDWAVIKNHVRPDQIGVYSGSGMGQMGLRGNGGMLQSRLMGKRVSSKQLAFGLCDMPGAFINAYVLGSVGVTGAVVGACATFLYNLLYGINDIRSGKCRVVLVGNSEAPIRPEIIDGYRTMGALAEDEALMALDGISGQPEYRRATRPFGENCGFTVSESAVYTVLMDDELAPASDDQLASVLGTWNYGWIPGIGTIDRIADDVHSSNLDFCIKHQEIDPESMDVALINSKGFGGNNATGLILSPFVARSMLETKHGSRSMASYQSRNEGVLKAANEYDQKMIEGEIMPIYNFGEGVVEGEDLSISDQEIGIPGFEKSVELNVPNPYPDMMV